MWRTDLYMYNIKGLNVGMYRVTCITIYAKVDQGERSKSRFCCEEKTKNYDS